jgi:prolyl oligopeptidase
VIYVRETTDPVCRLYVVDLPVDGGNLSTTLPCDPDDGTVVMMKIRANWEAGYAYVAHDGPVFTCKTNFQAPKYRLIRFSLEDPWGKEPVTLLPECDHVLQWATVAHGNALICNHLEHVKDVLRQYDLATGSLVRAVELPGVGTVSGFHAKRSSEEVFFSFTSFVDAGSSWSFSPASGETALWQQNVVPGLDLKDFVVEQVFVPSKDKKVQIPMSIVKPANDFVQDGSNVALMYAYGGFNITVSPAFNPLKLTLSKLHGGVYAVCNLRGGGEYGL